MKKTILAAAFAAMLLGTYNVASADESAKSCTTAQSSSCQPAAERVYNQAKDGTVKVYHKVADGTVSTYDKAADGTVKTYNKVADGTVNTYNKAKKGVSKGANTVKTEFNKIF